MALTYKSHTLDFLPRFLNTDIFLESRNRYPDACCARRRVVAMMMVVVVITRHGTPLYEVYRQQEAHDVGPLPVRVSWLRYHRQKCTKSKMIRT